ncbi:MAG: UDP-2,3-diacylglucosamine diphosphatase LpxI [Devosia sp.]
MARRLTLIAGSGSLAPTLLEAIRGNGDAVQVLGVADAALDGAIKVDVNAPQHILARVRGFGTTHLLLAGAVSISSEARSAWMRAAGLSGSGPIGDTVLSRALAAIAGKMGVALIGAHELVPSLLAPVGLIAGPPLDEAHTELAGFALSAARRAGTRDIGQALVMSGRHVMAAEDSDGTDALLRRVKSIHAAGQGDGAPLVLAKARKPGQPEFVDLPAIGPRTIANAVEAGISIVVIEARHTLLLDRAALEAAANDRAVSVLGLAADE